MGAWCAMSRLAARLRAGIFISHLYAGRPPWNETGGSGRKLRKLLWRREGVSRGRQADAGARGLIGFGQAVRSMFLEDNAMTPGRPRACARSFLHTLSTLLLGTLLTVASSHAVENPPVRLAVVNAPQQSGLLADLLPGFEADSGYKVDVYSGSDVFRRAELGKADLIICHYGKAPVESFISSGKGLWPRAVFSNQLVLVGPADDPAGIRGMTDPFAAMAKIAAGEAVFVSPSNPGARYLSEMLVAGAGVDKGTWYIETGRSKGRAVRFSEEKDAYTIWGAFPFERFRGKHDTDMEALVWESPVFHRLMVSIVVSPEHFQGANTRGARALEAWLLSPQIQARVAAFRETGIDHATWWPAARNNDPARLLNAPVAD